MKTAEVKKEDSTTKLVSNSNINDDKSMPSKRETSSNINILNNNIPNNTISNNIEFNKLQGFDVLEKLPPKSVNDTYNQEFYNTLDNLKFLSLSIPDEDKLFYHFEQNENASISAKIESGNPTINIPNLRNKLSIK